MNLVVICGRLTDEPNIAYTQGESQMCIANYSLAVDRRVRAGQEKRADFIRCVAFGKGGEFAEKYLHKGTKIIVRGHIQTGSYKDKDGRTVYTTDVIVDEQEFAESKTSAEQRQSNAVNGTAMGVNGANDFMQIPDGIDEQLPFN